MDATNLIAYLPFDSSTTEDKLGNEWTASGSPTIEDGALKLDGSSYLQMAEQFEFTGQPFTVSCKFSGTSNITGGAVCLWQMYIGAGNRFQIEIGTSGTLALWKDTDSTVWIKTSSSVLDGQIHHVECDFDGATWYLFLDGVLIGSKAHTCSARNYTLYLGINDWSGRKFTGTIDEFMIYDGIALHTENFTPPTAEEYADLKFALGVTTVPLTLNFDVERVIKNVQRIVQSLKVWLPFDSSPTEDLCGNEWTINGTISISNDYSARGNALNFTGNGYVYTTATPNLANNDFTFSWWEYIPSSINTLYADTVCVDGATGNSPRAFGVHFPNKGYPTLYVGAGTGGSWIISEKRIGSVIRDQWVHRAVVRSGNTIYAFENGQLYTSVAFSRSINVSTSILSIGGLTRNSRRFKGLIDEFQCYVGSALWTENFTPPTAEDYEELKVELSGGVELSFDVQRKLGNNVEVSFDIQRLLTHGVNLLADSQRQVFRTAELLNDVERIIANTITVDVQLSFDVQRKLKNNVQASFDSQRQLFYGTEVVADTQRQVFRSVNLIADVERFFRWRYENAGTADSLIVSGTTLTDLPETKSKTGTAFYQTVRAKCFDLPATAEVWMKFDVYFNGSNRWRAYNGGNNGTTGITAQTDGRLNFFSNGSNVTPNANSNFPVLTKNQLQTVLLHMVSGSSAGFIEAWVDGEKIYTYTGDVNHGEDFADIYLQSDGSGTFFSNVIISNKKLDFGDGWHSIYFDVERDVTKQFEINFDVERELIAPIYVPFIGEHFNHIIGSLNLTRGGKKKIILPKKSEVYIRAVGAGIIKVYSDTDTDGEITGVDYFTQNNLYARLDECETVYVEMASTVTQQYVIKAFIHSLKENAKLLQDSQAPDSAVDAAINFSTGGLIATREELANNFLRDLNAADDSLDFLERYCGVIYDNTDTGAITGSDAGGIEKTAESVVPEKIPVEDWKVPDAGVVVTINGLNVHFPTIGASGTLTDVEKHILAGLNSVWIKQSLDLIEESYGLNFTAEDVSVRDISVVFIDDENSHATASTSYSYDGHYTVTSLQLIINMKYFKDIDLSSEDGLLIPSSPYYDAAGYLDRTLAHELTHAVMAVNIKNFALLSRVINEGLAELVHGIDDLRGYTSGEGGDLVAFITSNEVEDLLLYDSLPSDNNAYYYVAGYLLLRYLAKQGQKQKPAVMPDELELTNLLISDGATDSDYEALTDNTRQIFAADILRALSCSFEGEFDIAILSVLTVRVLTDVLRNIIAQVNLFARQKEEPFNPDIPTPEPIDLPVDTKGIRDFEVSIAEQQISDQVRFTAVTPYDVQQEISGQYLDYKYNMVIERVQQQGILHSCECFSNINDLLYTQLNYKIPPITSWYKINGEQVGGTHTVEIKTVYPLASTHATSIAKALKLKAQIQFDNFLSTVLMDEKGGVTYNDLIRDIFGWSSRVPTMLINVFPRDGKLFFIQRGHETHSVNITQSKHTVPVITREIVRTSYGSSVESTTTINEYDITANTFTPDTIVGGEEGGGEEEQWVTLQDKSSGKNWTATTTYYYSKGNDMSPAGGKIPAGLLVKVETEKSYSYGSEEADSFTQIMHTYDSDGTRIGTETYVHYTGGTNPTTDTRNINLLRYLTLPNGEKYLASESTERYEEGETGYPDKLVDSTITNHSPTRLGQTHVTTITDDGIAGGVTGQNTGDDRITPYSQRKAQNAAAALVNANANGTWEETTTHYESGMTVYGLALFDSSFPIHDEATLIKVTNAIKTLNGKIKETVSLTVYDLEHLIDFDDTITFNGNSYFLVSNTARTTPRILLEQNLTLVRWT